MAQYLVGVDAGTTGCKVCVFDTEGKLLGSDYREYQSYYPHPGWVEQKEDEIVPALFETCKTAISKSGVDPKEIVAMALSTHGSTICFIGEDDKLVRDFVIWQDTRADVSYANETRKYISDDDFYQLTGINVEVLTMSMPKLMWFRDNEPETWAKTKIFGTHMDYFNRLFGADGFYTDLSSASREAMLDIDKQDWDPKLHEIAGIPLSKRGKVISEPGKVIGEIGPDISEKTGLPVGCKICLGAHDQNCNTFGGGLLYEGDAVMVIGTFGSCFMASDKSIRDPKQKLIVKSNHGIGNYTIEAFSNTAASSFRWYRDTFCQYEVAKAKEEGRDVYDMLTESMQDVPIGSNGVVFLPFLAGAAGARLNYNAKATFLGATLGTTKKDMARAVLEGICFEMYDIVKMQEAAGISAKQIKLTGGAAKSPFWSQMLADMMGVPVQLLEASETGCLGAAMYAGVGVGIYKDVYDAVDKAVGISKTYYPDPSKKDAYEAAYKRWTQAYEALDGTFYC